MGNFVEHIEQAESNLDFLEKVNLSVTNSWDWQVTTCFYVAVHLINAHVAKKTKKNYLTHKQVEGIINPYVSIPIASLDVETYKSYTKLHQLSRRSRYLLNTNYRKEGYVDVQPACMTYDKHFKKAIYHLDVILRFTTQSYNVNFRKYEVACLELNKSTFVNFKILK